MEEKIEDLITKLDKLNLKNDSSIQKVLEKGGKLIFYEIKLKLF